MKAVYCSHVIEHIEDSYIQALFADVYRVLMSGGVFRIACPDAEFMYNVSKFQNDYWRWLRPYFSPSFGYTGNYSDIKAVDCLVREVATPRLKDYAKAVPDSRSYVEEFEKMSMDEFLKYITCGLEYRKDVPGDHINYWTFDKVKAALESAGFPVIVRSKYAGSICHLMTWREKFDTTHPEMSLYVEAMK